MVDFNYKDPAIHYSGRWVDYTGSAGSAWGGSQIRFAVQGSTLLRVTLGVLDQGAGSFALAIFNINGGLPQIRTISTDAESYNGDAVLDIALPSTGKHTVIVRFSQMPSSQFNLTSYVRLKKITLNTGGVLLSWGDKAPYMIQTVGDSWLAGQFDWSYLLGAEDFDIYPINFGGARLSQLSSQYEYESSGVLISSEPLADVIFIASGINDRSDGVSTSDYKTSQLILIDDVRERQPQAKIIIAGAPRNINTGVDFNVYNQVNSEVATSRDNVVFIPIPNSFSDTLAWDGDQIHLSAEGRLAYANWWKIKLREYLPQVYGSKLNLKTNTRLYNFNLYPEGYNLTSQSVHVRLNEGIYKVKLEPVPTNTTDKVLIKTDTSLYALVE